MKKFVIGILFTICLCTMLIGCGNNSNYDGITELKTKSVMNGSKDKEIGKYGEAKYNNEKLTDEILVNFYNAKIKDSELNWVVLLDEKDTTKGIIFSGCNNVFEVGTISEDGSLEKSEKTGIIEDGKVVYK